MSSVTAIYKNLQRKSKRVVKRLLSPFGLDLSQQSIVEKYLKGCGIEIGALHNPLKVPPSLNVRYVDRMAKADLQKHYPELASHNLVEVDIIDDGERLEQIKDGSQDFVIAHQFLEHCQDPIGAIQNMLRVLKPKGILYLSVPDKRYCFDQHRPVTPIDHLLRDYREGPAWSRAQHFHEWAVFVNLGYTNEKDSHGDPRVEEQHDRLMAMDYSIHYHVWTPLEILELMVTLKKTLNWNFEVELFYLEDGNIILILRKP